jgi:hypothetical protein
MLGKRLLKSLVVLIVIAVSLTLNTVASPVGNVVIQNVGTITPYITAKSGSPADIQAAVNAAAAAGGGTVQVPAGTWIWTNPSTTSLSGDTMMDSTVITIPAGVNVIGTGLAGCGSHPTWTPNPPQTIIQLASPAPPNGPGVLFFVTGHGYSSSLSSRVSGIAFIQPQPSTLSSSSESGTAIGVFEAQNFRIDHCSFYNFSNVAVSVVCNDASNHSACTYGVIDHCIVNDSYKLISGNSYQWGYGFYATGNMQWRWGNWDNNTLDFLGKYEAIASCALMYVEDCSFDYCRHCTDGMAGAWNVVRFCLAKDEYPNYGYFDIHGTGNRAYGNAFSARGEEVYNNTVYGVAGSDGNNVAVRVRGGSAFIYSNTYFSVDSGSYCVQLDDYDYSTMYPYTNINMTYIWSNTYSNCIGLNVLQGTQNVNYFLRAPSQTQDGFTYTPYTYPIATG